MCFNCVCYLFEWQQSFNIRIWFIEIWHLERHTHTHTHTIHKHLFYWSFDVCNLTNKVIIRQKQFSRARRNTPVESGRSSEALGDDNRWRRQKSCAMRKRSDATHFIPASASRWWARYTMYVTKKAHGTRNIDYNIISTRLFIIFLNALNEAQSSFSLYRRSKAQRRRVISVVKVCRFVLCAQSCIECEEIETWAYGGAKRKEKTALMKQKLFRKWVLRLNEKNEIRSGGRWLDRQIEAPHSRNQSKATWM